MNHVHAEPPRPGDDYAIPPRPTEVIAARAAHQSLRREIVAAGGGSIAASLLPADDPAESQRAIDHGGAVAVPEAGDCEAPGDCRCQGAVTAATASSPLPPSPLPPVALLVDRVDFAVRLRVPVGDLLDHGEALRRLTNELVYQDRRGIYAPMGAAEIDRILGYRIGEAEQAIAGLKAMQAEIRQTSNGSKGKEG